MPKQKKGVINELTDLVLPPKKKYEKMDVKLVAAKDNHESEVKYIAKTYKVPIKVVRSTMKAVGKNGKPSRSRALIYAGLRALGYEIKIVRKR